MLEMILSLAGGLGLFLFGMRHMGDGLQKLAGNRLRRLLEVLTSNPVMGVVLGAVVTALVQSSSATTVMIVGFVNAGLMTLSQAIGVIMGANIGTTVTAQLIAFDIGEYALPIVALGALPYLFGRRKWHRYLGQVIIGFGILFIGMETMKVAMKPLGESAGFTELTLALSQNWFYGILGGVGMTAILQSSSATIGILQGLASEGLVNLKLALPVLFGDNIGTTVTALLSSIGTSLAARRAAVSHLLFNVIGTVVFIITLPWVTRLVAITADTTTRQIANAHTFFNVGNTLIQLPFAGLLAYVVTRLLPGRPADREQTLHLDRRLMATPSIALEQAQQEVLKMGELTIEMLRLARRNIAEQREADLDRIVELERTVDEFEAGLTTYLVEVSKLSLSEAESTKHSNLYHLINDIERVGDHAENIQELLAGKAEMRCAFSEQAIRELEEFTDYVIETLRLALDAWQTDNKSSAEGVAQRESHIDEAEKSLRSNHITRLNSNLCAPVSGILFLDIISNLERVGDHAMNIAEVYLSQRAG